MKGELHQFHLTPATWPVCVRFLCCCVGGSTTGSYQSLDSISSLLSSSSSQLGHSPSLSRSLSSSVRYPARRFSKFNLFCLAIAGNGRVASIRRTTPLGNISHTNSSGKFYFNTGQHMEELPHMHIMSNFLLVQHCTRSWKAETMCVPATVNSEITERPFMYQP